MTKSSQVCWCVGGRHCQGREHFFYVLACSCALAVKVKCGPNNKPKHDAYNETVSDKYRQIIYDNIEEINIVDNSARYK